MNEYTQGLYFSLGILLTLIYSTFWWLGGRPGGRIFRRFLAPVFFSVSLIGYALLLHKFLWWHLLSIPAYWITSTIGYGGNNFLTKLGRRLLWALVYSCASVVFVLFSGEWIIFSVQSIISVVVSITFGLTNPFESSPKEEGAICFASSFLVPFMI